MENTNRILIILKNIIVAYIITIILFMIYALILSFTNISESTIPIATNLISMLGIFIASSATLIKFKEKGLINGAKVGGVYAILLYIFSGVLGRGFALDGKILVIILLDVIIGMIGGIIGVNFGKN